MYLFTATHGLEVIFAVSAIFTLGLRNFANPEVVSQYIAKSRVNIFSHSETNFLHSFAKPLLVLLSSLARRTNGGNGECRFQSFIYNLLSELAFKAFKGYQELLS